MASSTGRKTIGKNRPKTRPRLSKHHEQSEDKDSNLITPQKLKNYRGAVAASKSTGHGRASRLIYVTLDPPRKRTDDVKLQAPRASYVSRPSRVARRGKRKSNRSRVVQKADQVYLVLGSARAGFSSHHNPSFPLYQKWSPLGSTVSW